MAITLGKKGTPLDFTAWDKHCYPLPYRPAGRRKHKIYVRGEKPVSSTLE